MKNALYDKFRFMIRTCSRVQLDLMQIYSYTNNYSAVKTLIYLILNKMDTQHGRARMKPIFPACCAYADRDDKKLVPFSLNLFYIGLTIV